MKTARRPLITRMTAAVTTAAMVLAFGAATVAAHHSYGASYDASRTVTVNGGITEVSWTNPHIYITMEIAGVGETPPELRVLDMPAPSRAQNMGLTRDMFDVGTRLTVDAWPSRTNHIDLAPVQISFDETGQTIRIR